MNPSSEISRFLETELPELASVERTILDTQLERGVPLVVYGCGKLGRKLVRGLRTLGEAPLAFVDGNEKLWGETVENLPVHSLEEAVPRFGKTSTMVVTLWSPGKDRRFAAMRQTISGAGFGNVVHFLPLFWKHAELFLPHYRLDLPSRMLERKEEVRAAFDLLQDSESKNEYLVQLRWMLQSDAFSVPPGRPIAETYFPDDLFTLSSDEHFIDCGAFDGDTMRAFFKRTNHTFKGVVAYEPDPENYQKLDQYVRSLPPTAQAKIRLEKCALGTQRGIVRFEAMGSVSSSIVDAGSIEVELQSLDESLGDIAPTYIKMDIEGAEMDALSGAKRIIQGHHPRLAACVYHTQAHLWQIPLRMNAFNPRYRLYLRRYDDEFGDVVCYAVPPAG